MQLGVFVAYGPWYSAAEQLALARQADDLDFHSVWVAESYGQDASTVLGALAAVTDRIRLGAAIMQIPARQPTAAATAAATLDRISGGRALLGLGLSGPQVSEGWYGVPFTAPLRRTREYVEIVRAALSRQKVIYSGTEWTIPTVGGLGLGKPLKMLDGGPVQDHLPIYLGVGGPRTVEQCGRIADGWLPFLFSPEHAELLVEPLHRGLEKAGRDRSEVRIAPTVPTAVDDDIDVARNAVRDILAFYLGGMGTRDKNFYVDLATRYGHAESALACQDHFLSGDRRAAGQALTRELVDTMALVATPDSLGTRLRAYEAAGVDTLIVMPFGDRSSLLEILARTHHRQQ